MHSKILPSFLLVALIGCGNQSDPKAVETLSRMAQAYADCDSYRDIGEVQTVFYTANGTNLEVKPFRTAFVRPDQFRFEFRVQGQSRSRYVVWQRGAEIRTKWDLRNLEESESSLGMALAGATGVSSGSAHTIPALLMPDEVGGRLLTDVRSMEYVGERETDGVSCHCVAGTYANHPIKLWIDKEDYMIRRIESTTDFDDFTTEATTTYDPEINQDIKNSMLKFGPI